MTTSASVLSVAKSQLGYLETGSNQTKYWAELEPGLQGQPWCAGFVSWVFKHAGAPLPAMGREYGFVYVPSAVSYAKAHGLWDESGRYAPGDIVCYGNGVHTGIIASDNGTTMAVYEGNTSPDGSSGSQTNGGGVFLRHRPHGDWVNGVIKTAGFLATTTTTLEDDMPLSTADADLVVKRLLGTLVGRSGMSVATALERATYNMPAPMDTTALVAAMVKLVPSGVALSEAQVADAAEAAIRKVLGALDGTS